MPASELLLDFYNKRYLPTKRRVPATEEQYRIQIGNLNRYFHTLAEPPDKPRSVTLADLSDELVTGAMNWLVDQGDVLPTANKLRSHINAVWNFASRWLAKRGVTILRPDNEPFRVDLEEPIAWTPEEFAAMLDATRHMPGVIGSQWGYVPAADWWELYVRLSYNCGARVSAMRGTPTAKLDLVRAEVLIPARVQKQHADQRCELFPRTVELIRRLKIVERGVPTLLGDWPYTTRTLTTHFAKLYVIAGIFPTIDDVPRSHKTHIMRKTLATNVADKHGVHKASELLGHSSIVVTRRYVDRRGVSAPSLRSLIPDPGGSPQAAPPLRIADVG